MSESTEEVDARLDACRLGLRSRLHTADEVKAMPPPEALVSGMLFRNTTAVLWGPPGSSKSFVAQHLAMSVASGTRFDGRKVEFAPALIIAAEGVAGLGQRIDAWQHHNQVWELPELKILSGAVNLIDDRWRTALVELAAEITPSILVLDTLARCIPGADENSAKDMGVAVEAMDELRRTTGATVLAAHHSRKDSQTMRGSTALLGAVDTSIEVGSDGQLVYLRNEKQKDAPEFETIRLWRTDVRSSCVLTSPPSQEANGLAERQSLVLSTLAEIDAGGGVSTTVWEKSLPNGVAVRTFYRDRKLLVDAGLVGSSGAGQTKRYHVTDEGKGVLGD